MKLLKKWVLLLLAGLLLSLTACGREAPPPPEGTIPVTVSFGAMEKLTKAIGGSAVSITVMVPDGTEPHDFEPRAEDMVKLSRSRLFVYNGMGMEHWAEKAIRGAASPGLITVDASARVAPILLTDPEWHPFSSPMKRKGRSTVPTTPIPGWACLKQKKRPGPFGTGSLPPPRRTGTSL